MRETNLKNRLAVLLGAGLIAAACTHDSIEAAVKIGEAAPGFSLPDSNGKERKLEDFKGKVVVLEWHNHECPYVRKHYGSGNIPKLQKDYGAKDVVWLTIISSAEGKQGYVTGKKANENMKKAKASPKHVLLDPEGKVGRLYGAKTTPHLYVIDKEGSLRYNGAIDSIASTDPDDIEEAENYAAKALESVLAGKEVATPLTRPYGCSVKYK